MSNPASELDRPCTSPSNRQAWGQDGRGGGGASGAGAAVVDTYDYDDGEEIRKKGCWYKFSTFVSREYPLAFVWLVGSFGVYVWLSGSFGGLRAWYKSKGGGRSTLTSPIP